jgi:transcriptional regulator with XRE-family HTH domain
MENPEILDLISLIRKSRLRHELTQYDLSKLSGISVRTISRIENGQSSNLYTLNQLLNSLREFSN